MSDEAAFLRALQADPTDTTAKLVYADWLDEHGENAKAEYVRATVVVSRQPTADITHSRVAELGARLPSVWLSAFHGAVTVWDEVTMLALGRLQGLFQAIKLCSDHASDTAYDFFATLAVKSGELQELADRHYGPDCQPVRLEPLADWKADLKAILREWLLMELRHARCTNGTRLSLEVDWGRDAVVQAAFDAVIAILTPTAGWRVHITENRWYAINWADLMLESANRVLFLHFSFSD